jgi:hypothetical protein
MNRFVGLGVVLIVVFCVFEATALSEEPDDSPAAQLEKSLKTWLKLKKECGGNYSYSIRFSSWVGFGHETTIVIRDNKVAERRYRSWSGQPQIVAPVEPGKAPQAAKPDGESWTEKGKDLGSHKKGASAKTLDDLYAIAAEVATRELSDFEKRYIRFDEQGILQSCFTIDTRIADDAPRNGVAIHSLKLGKHETKVYKSPNGKAFPTHWGAPPLRQTRDLRILPGGYGRGSGTLARWIQENLDRDARR